MVMATVTKNEILNYFSMYKDFKSVTFTKEVISALGLDVRQIYLKISNDSFPCIIYKVAFTNAEVLVSLDKDVLEKIKKAKETVYLRFYFVSPKKDAPIAFLVPSVITSWSIYDENKSNLFFVHLSFLRTPPDDLIYLLGSLIDANKKFSVRKNERIDINPISIKRLGIRSKISFIKAKDCTIKSIIKDISLSGSKLIISSLSNLNMGDLCQVACDFEQEKHPFFITGKIVQMDELTPHKLTSIALQYEDDAIPLNYKIYINEYLRKKKFYIEEQNSDQT